MEMWKKLTTLVDNQHIKVVQINFQEETYSKFKIILNITLVVVIALTMHPIFHIQIIFGVTELL